MTNKNKKKVRIAFISLMGGSAWGGSEALWHATALHALERGDEVCVSVYHWGEPHAKIKQLQQLGALIHFRKRYDSDLNFLNKVMRFVKHRVPDLHKEYKAIINFKPDCVFISQGDNFDLVIHHRPLYHLLRRNQLAFSIVCHNHPQYSFLPSAPIFAHARAIFSAARNVFFVSHRQWHLTERWLARKIGNGIFTWNPLNLEVPHQPLSWPANPIPQLAIVASLQGNKGHDTAFEVLGRYFINHDWHLNLYGEGEGMQYLLDLAAFYGIQERVTFHGYQHDIQQVWKINHLLIIPSSVEGLPISLVEAMACGRPSAVTDVGGITELVDEGEIGFVADSPNAHSFAEALQQAFNNFSRWEQMGRSAFIRVQGFVHKSPQEAIYNALTSKQGEMSFCLNDEINSPGKPFSLITETEP